MRWLTRARARARTARNGMTFWPFKRRGDANKSSSPSQARELRIATSGSFSIKAPIEMLRVDGAGSYSQPARVRAALFTPGAATTLQFHADHNKKPGSCARASCVHALQMLTPAETSDVLDDVKRIGASIGWCAYPPETDPWQRVGQGRGTQGRARGTHARACG